MKPKYGHATPDQVVIVQELERRLAKDPHDLSTLVTLVAVYLDPCRREFDAVDLLRQAARIDPTETSVAFWMAYCDVHVEMSAAALHDAAQRARSILEQRNLPAEYAAAALMIQEEALNDLFRDKQPSDWSPQLSIRTLEQAVSSMPSWQLPHSRLAYAYRNMGRLEEATREIGIRHPKLLAFRPEC